MILYHGTNLVINQIDLSVCRPHKDFGQGFYLTTIEDQAQKMAKRVSRIYGGKPTINIYHFDESIFEKEILSIRRFDQPTIEWALFVTNNRNDLTDKDNNIEIKYDIVIGPVADDDLSVLFNLFSDGFIDETALMNGMKFKRLTDQYSFHTEKAISHLHKERDYIVES